METAEHREPYESRGSRTDLGAPGGESPPGDSTKGGRITYCWIRAARRVGRRLRGFIFPFPRSANARRDNVGMRSRGSAARKVGKTIGSRCQPPLCSLHSISPGQHELVVNYLKIATLQTDMQSRL